MLLCPRCMAKSGFRVEKVFSTPRGRYDLEAMGFQLSCPRCGYFGHFRKRMCEARRSFMYGWHTPRPDISAMRQCAFRGRSLIAPGQAQEGLALLTQGLAELRVTGGVVSTPRLFTWLAEAHAIVSQISGIWSPKDKNRAISVEPILFNVRRYCCFPRSGIFPKTSLIAGFPCSSKCHTHSLSFFFIFSPQWHIRHHAMKLWYCFGRGITLYGRIWPYSPS
jgi:hypothetical protein